MGRMTVADLAGQVADLRDMMTAIAEHVATPATKPAAKPATPKRERKFAESAFGAATASLNTRFPRKSEKRRHAITSLRATLGITTCEHGLKGLMEMANSAGYDTSSL